MRESFKGTKTKSMASRIKRATMHFFFFHMLKEKFQKSLKPQWKIRRKRSNILLKLKEWFK